MENEIKFDLRPMIELLIRRWRWVVGIPAAAVLIALVVIIRHHENIGRLMKGTERPFHFRKPKGVAS